MGGFNGNGTYVRYFNWQQDAANGVNITASRVDTEDNGYASGLSMCVTRDGQGKMSADFTPNTDNTLNLGTQALRWASINGISTAFLVALHARKSADLGRTANSVLPDPDLTVSIPGAGSYVYDMVLNIWGTGASNQGVLLSPDFSGSITQMFSRLDYGSAGGVGSAAGQSAGGNGVFIVSDVLA